MSQASGVAAWQAVVRRLESDQGPPITAPLVSLTNAHKTYGTGDGAVHALRGVSLEFRPGRFHAILGPSGSGKSTLLHLAAGLDVPTSGSVRLLGKETGPLDDAELARLRRRSIGIVFQFFNLVPTLSVAENALLPILLDRKCTKADDARLARLLAAMEIEQKKDRLPEELSGGERQRAAIVRAMLPGPPLLLADEPTGSLDSVTGAAITKVLRAQASEHGVCLIVVTHDPRVAEQADEVISLQDGVVVAHEGR